MYNLPNFINSPLIEQEGVVQLAIVGKTSIFPYGKGDYHVDESAYYNQKEKLQRFHR